MNRKASVDRERGRVSFALYAYPFEATHIAPAEGGENVEQVIVEDPSVTIAQREHPSEWNLVCEESLWWISFDEKWLRKRGIQIPSNRTQYELAFLVTALNICVPTEVFFTRFARREYPAIISNGEVKRPSDAREFIAALQRPVPNTVVIDGHELAQVTSRLFTVILLEDNDSDLSKAIDSYRAAIQSFDTEVHARLLYSVCENVLFSGNPAAEEKDRTIAEISTLDKDEGEAWRHLVNRTKHPDEGTPYSWDDTFEDVPPPVEFRMREAANEALRRQILTE